MQMDGLKSRRDSANSVHGSVLRTDFEEDQSKIWDFLPKKLRVKKRVAYIRRHSDLKVSSTYKKFALLMWKNSLVTHRRWRTSLIQLTVPVLLVTILVICIFNTRRPGYTDRIYKPFKVDVKQFSQCNTIYFRPENPVMIRVKQHLEEAFNENQNDHLQFKFLDLSNGESTPTDLCALIHFLPQMWDEVSNDTLPTIISYEIQLPAVHQDSEVSLVSIGEKWDTAFRDPTHLIDGSREVDENEGGHPGYEKYGFLYIQHLIATELSEIIWIKETKKISKLTEEELREKFYELNEKISFRLSRFPYPAHPSEDSVVALYVYLPCTLVIGFGISGLLMVYLSVRERTMGIRQLLKMYGIGNAFHRSSWVLHNLLYLSVSALSITLILSVKWKNDMFEKSIIDDFTISEHFFVLLICYIFYILCTITLLLCFFSRPSSACISVTFIWAVSYAPYVYIQQIFNILTFWEKAFCCLSCNTAIGVGCHLIAALQASGGDVRWSKAFQGDFTLGWLYIIMIVYGVIEILLASYISKVFPEDGMPKLPWNYLFKLWYWSNELPPEEFSAERLHDKSFEENHPEYFENDSHIKKRRELNIEHVSKYIGNLRVVHKMNLVCHQGHVTVLLGDQGSGKSKLLKMLTGTMSPSGGIIYLNRKDLYKNHILARVFVGYCPSEDLLFPDLTVEETLQFFTDLKGLTHRIEAYEDVERLLKITMLADFRDTRVCELTKSSQRILMVATAFCGGSRVVLLDDPTLNLSAAQQRVLWDFADQEKKHRTVVVAMDLVHEIDAVVDKVVLFHYGQITTRGSPEFLQDKFGGGYHLEIETKRNFFRSDDLRNLVERRIKGSSLFHSEPGLLNFYLPPSQTPSFPGVLEELETSKERYKLTTFRVKFITLEELHLSLKRLSSIFEEAKITAKMKQEKENNKTVPSIKSRRKRILSEVKIDIPLPPPKDKQNFQRGFCGAFHEFRLMFLKNVKYNFRNRVLFWGSTIGPFIMLTIVHCLVYSVQLEHGSEPHRLDYKDYMDVHLITSMYSATNEGVFMRSSVDRLARDRKGRVRYKHKEDIVKYILSEYKDIEDESKIPLLGIDISPVREMVNGREKVKVGLTGYFNNQPLHTPGVALALVDNIFLDNMEDYIRRKINPVYERKGYCLNVSNHPLVFQPPDVLRFSEILFGPGFVFGICSSFSYALAVSSYIILHVKEQDFRHIQFMFGANKLIFWATNYLWNFIHFTIIAILHMLLIVAFGVPGYHEKVTEHGRVLPVIFIFLEVYGLTSVFIVGSFASHCFKSWGRGYSKTALFFILTGPVFMMILIPLEGSNDAVADGFYTFLHNVFLLFPSYAFGVGMFFIITNEAHITECKKFDKYIAISNCENTFPEYRIIHPFNEFDNEGSAIHGCCFRKRNPFSMVALGVGRNIFMMVLVIIACAVQKVFHHSKKFRELDKKCLDKKEKKTRPVLLDEHEIRDYDVLAEAARIGRGEDHRDLTIKNLTLETPTYIKMKNICLEVQKGECFALLGAVGAGKSTFLRTLCGFPGVMPTFGDIEYHGKSLVKDFDEYISSFSYCPDKNPFLDELTALEILELVGVLRKIPPDALEDYIRHYAGNLGMMADYKKVIKGYSFVMTKKLCMAVAMMGSFEVLLLDDPTHHFEPKSRDFINGEVKRVMDRGCIVIWASHSIELCESVCTRMSILVNGHMRCIGSLQHLKDLYEEGYTVIVRFILDKDMIYFTNKKQAMMENAIRLDEVDEVTGASIGKAKQEQRRQVLIEVLQEDADIALHDLAPWEQDLVPFVAFFERNFPKAILVDKQPGFVHYHVHENDAQWSALFGVMEEAKVLADVDYYYVCRSNLDQVYFNYTRGQVTFEEEIS